MWKRTAALKELFTVRVAIGSVLLIMCMAIVGLAAVSLSRSHDQYQKQVEITASNLCIVLSYNLISSYEKIDIAVLGLKDEFEQQLSSGSINSPRIERFIKLRVDRIPALSGLRTANAEGIIEHGNDVPPGSRVSIADRDYFIKLKTDPGAGLVFSKPILGRVIGKWMIILARRINRSDGSFAGIAYGTIELARLNALFSSISIGNDGIVSLRDQEFAVIVRRGGLKDLTGQSTVSNEFLSLIKEGRSSGTFTVVSPVDNTRRIYSYIKLQPYNQYLHVGLGYDEYFIQWRRELYKTAGFVVFIFIITGSAVIMIYYVSKRRMEAEAELQSLRGLLPICSNCKKIRDDSGYWNQIEAYISSHSRAQFSHSICPDCVKLLYPGFINREGGDGE